MLRYFPIIYEDEILYSLISRYDYDTYNKNAKVTFKELFGTSNVVISIDFPCKIKKLSQQLKTLGSSFEDNIIFSHTMYPLFYPFLDKRRQMELKQEMLDVDGKKIHMKIGIMASKIRVNRNLRYCPLCVEEEIKLAKEPYWHRSHNIPGVYFCYKHMVALSEKCSVSGKYIYKRDTRALIPLKKAIEDGNVLTGLEEIFNKDICENEKNRLIQIAQSVHKLLEFEAYKYNICCDNVYNVYYYKLEQANLLDNSDRVKLKDIEQCLSIYYGQDILELLNLQFESEKAETWLKGFFGKRAYTISHPIKHIAIINWLYDGKIEEFLQDLLRKLVRKKEQYWPCLNKAANHYREPVIKGYDLKYNSTKKYYIATFSCSCGFRYTRRLEKIDDIYIKSRVIQFGDVWERKLKELLEDKTLCISEVARRLDTDKTVVLAHGIKLGIIDKSKARKYKRRECNDKVWVRKEKKINTENGNRIVQIRRVDWSKRDGELSRAVEQQVEKYIREGDSKKITISRIGKELNCLYLLQKHLDKLPLTKEILQVYI